MPSESFGKNEIKINPENLHNEFMESFNEDEIIDNFKQSDLNEKGRCLYQKDLPNGFIYNISGRNYENENENEKGRIFDFHLSEPNSNKPCSAFMFTEEKFKSEENEIYLNMNHCLIHSKDFGISGSDFLKKSEEYFSILKENELLKDRKIGVFVSQLSVLSWLLKNDFNFTKGNKEDLLKYIKSENGIPTKDDNDRFILNDQYTLISLEDRHNVEADNNGIFLTKDEYIIKKEFLTNPEFQELRDKYYKEGSGDNLGKKVLIFDGGRRGGRIVEDLTKAGLLMPRFILEKEIK